MSQEIPNDDTRQEKAPTKGTNKPWKVAPQQSQNPGEPNPSQPDLEKWQQSKTK